MERISITHRTFKCHETSETRETFLKRLRKEGYRCIGSGAYASVHARKGDDFVIKVGWDLADTWLEYAAKLKTSKPSVRNNPWFPKIHSVDLYECKREQHWNDDTYFVAVIERLKPIRETQVNNGYIAEIENVVYASKSRKNNFFKFLNVKHHFFDAIDLIGSIKEGCVDIHSGNIMMRGNQMVITDPLSY